MSHILGIDIGSSRVAAALQEPSGPSMVLAPDGSRTSASYLCFDPSGELQVGEDARKRSLTESTITVSHLRQLLGRPPDHPVVRSIAAAKGLTLQAGESGLAQVVVHGRPYNPEQLLAASLQRLLAAATEQFVCAFDGVVLVLPSDLEPQSHPLLQQSLELAGTKLVGTLSELDACCAALAHVSDGESILLLHVGASNLRVLLARAGAPHQVLAQSALPNLGGDAYTQRLTEVLAAQVLLEDGVDLRQQPGAWARLWFAVEGCKHALSTSESAPVKLPFLADGRGAPVHVQATISRDTFEECSSDITERIAQIAKQTMAKAGLTQVDHLFLLGGSSRTPRIQVALEEIARCKAPKGFNPDETCAIAAARHGASLTTDGVSQTRSHALAFPLSVVCGDEQVLLPLDSPLPAEGCIVLDAGAAPRTRIDLLAGSSQSIEDRKLVASLAPTGTQVAGATLKITVDRQGLLAFSATAADGALWPAVERSLPWLVHTQVVDTSLEGQDMEAIHRLRAELERKLVELEALSRDLLVAKTTEKILESALRLGRVALSRSTAQEGLTMALEKVAAAKIKAETEASVASP